MQHDRTLSKLRYDRKISQEATCLRCNATIESTLHILRGCPKVIETWKKFTDVNYRNANVGLDIPEWLHMNLVKLNSNLITLSGLLFSWLSSVRIGKTVPRNNRKWKVLCTGVQQEHHQLRERDRVGF